MSALHICGCRKTWRACRASTTRTTPSILRFCWFCHLSEKLSSKYSEKLASPIEMLSMSITEKNPQKPSPRTCELPCLAQSKCVFSCYIILHHAKLSPQSYYITTSWSALKFYITNLVNTSTKTTTSFGWRKTETPPLYSVAAKTTFVLEGGEHCIFWEQKQWAIINWRAIFQGAALHATHVDFMTPRFGGMEMV